MFLKMILIILGVIVMGKFLSWIAGIFISHKKLSEEHNGIKNLIEDKLSEEHNEIKDLIIKNTDLLGEKGNLRENIDKILEIKKVEKEEQKSLKESIKYIYDEHKKEEGRRSNLNEKELDMNKTIEHINVLNKNYIDQKFEIQQVKFENNLLNEKITELNKLLEELRDENFNLKNLQEKEENELKGDNNKLYQNLLKNSSIKKDELILMFKDNKIYADKDGNAIFPLKDEMGNEITGYKIDLSKDGEPILYNQEDIEKVKLLANKVFKSIEVVKEKSKELEEDYEQEL